PARGLGIPWRDAVPDAPDVLPAFPALAIEERELQVVGLVPVPAVRDVHHVARLEPSIAIDRRHKFELVLSPGHQVPCQGFIRRAALRLKGERMTDLLR